MSKLAREERATDAAVRLHMARDRVVRKIQVGELRGRRDAALGWLVESASIDEFLTRNPPVGGTRRSG